MMTPCKKRAQNTGMRFSNRPSKYDTIEEGTAIFRIGKYRNNLFSHKCCYASIAAYDA